MQENGYNDAERAEGAKEKKRFLPLNQLVFYHPVNADLLAVVTELCHCSQQDPRNRHPPLPPELVKHHPCGWSPQ